MKPVVFISRMVGISLVMGGFIGGIASTISNSGLTDNFPLLTVLTGCGLLLFAIERKD